MTRKQKLKNVIFISDLHLGVGRTNDFHASYYLHRLLDYAEQNANELVILGDFLELLQSDFLAIYSEYHLIFEHLFRLAKKIPVKYVVGNHDIAVAADCDPHGDSHFLGSQVEVLPEYSNLPLKIFALHGHQFSLANRRDDNFDPSEISLGDRITRLAGWLEEKLNPKIDNFCEQIYLVYKKFLRRISQDPKNFADLVTPANPNYQALGGDFSEYERGARELLTDERYSLVVFGHTHLQKIETLGDKIYANCGSWVGDDQIEFPPVFLDVDAHSVRLINAKTLQILKNVSRRTTHKLKLAKARPSLFRNKVLI
ncbi:MAG: UDP-2,3-diacylglucosamine diphosphatase [Patescibacteria group bacterium]